MDMRTGKLYDSLEEARAADVPESDLAEVELDDRGKLKPKVRFRKHRPFASIRNEPARG